MTNIQADLDRLYAGMKERELENKIDLQDLPEEV